MYLSEQERDRRHGLVRRAMNEAGVDALRVVGNNHYSGSPLFSTGSFRYLTDFFIFSLYGLLLFFREDEPVVLVPPSESSGHTNFSWDGWRHPASSFFCHQMPAGYRSLYGWTLVSPPSPATASGPCLRLARCDKGHHRNDIHSREAPACLSRGDGMDGELHNYLPKPNLAAIVLAVS
jgi:hypothetical protein